MFAQFIIRIILVTLLGPLVLRDCGAVFITDPIKMTRSQCVGSVSFLDESQNPRVTFNRSVKRVRRLEAREVRVEGCGCFVLYKLRHYRGSSQQVGPGLSEVNFRWVRSVERTDCEGYSEPTKIRKTHQVRNVDTSTQQPTTTALATAETLETTPTTVLTVTTVPTTTAEVTLSTASTRPTVLKTFTFATIATTKSTTATSEEGGWASTKIKSHAIDDSALIEQTTKGPVVIMKPNPTSERNINKHQSNKTSATKSVKKTLIIVKTELFSEDLTETWTETYQSSPMSVNTVSPTTESGSVTHFVKTTEKQMNWEKTKSLSGFQDINSFEKTTENATLIKYDEAFLEEITTELNQQVGKTAVSEIKAQPQKVYQHEDNKEESLRNKLDMELDATMTNNKIETDTNYVDAIDPITAHKAANDIQRESLEPKMSSLVSSMSNSALKQRHPIVFILIVQIVLK